MKVKKQSKKQDKNKPNPLKYDLNMVQKIAAVLEASNIEDFLDLRNRPFRLMFWNFWIGVSRGIGFLLGATVVGAVLIAWGKHVVVSLGGLPWVGEKVADALVYIQQLMQGGGAK